MPKLFLLLFVASSISRLVAQTPTYYVDAFCTVPGALNDGCLSNAIAAHPMDAKFIFRDGTWNFAKTVTITNSSNLEIMGEGPGTILLMSSGHYAIQFKTSTHVSIHDLNIRTSASPLIVTPAQFSATLPTSNPNQPIAIDRYSSGYGYPPTTKDADIAPGCSSRHCLSTAQLNNYDVGLEIDDGDDFNIYNLTGYYYGILSRGLAHSRIHDNYVLGGTNFTAAIAFWPGKVVSTRNTIDHNVVLAGGNSGIFPCCGSYFDVIGNHIAYMGESGVKTGQSSGYQADHVNIVGNTVDHVQFDSFDISSNYCGLPNPAHCGTIFDAQSTLVGNTASYGGSGIWGDGRHWTIANNILTSNRDYGIGVDVCDSLIANNVATNNNTASSSYHHLMIGVSSNYSCASKNSGNTVTGNVVDTGGHPGYAMALNMHGITSYGNLYDPSAKVLMTYAPSGRAGIPGQPDYAPTANSGETLSHPMPSVWASAGWYKLGTWVAKGDEDLGITIYAGQGLNHNSNQQGMVNIVARRSGSDGPPNILGLSAYCFGAVPLSSIKLVATGASTAAGNLSWDLYVQINGFAGGHYTVSPGNESTWTADGSPASDPGSASSTVVVGNMYAVNLTPL